MAQVTAFPAILAISAIRRMGPYISAGAGTRLAQPPCLASVLNSEHVPSVHSDGSHIGLISRRSNSFLEAKMVDFKKHLGKASTKAPATAKNWAAERRPLAGRDARRYAILVAANEKAGRGRPAYKVRGKQKETQQAASLKCPSAAKATWFPLRRNAALKCRTTSAGEALPTKEIGRPRSAGLRNS